MSLVILPEMLVAGEQALAQCRKADLSQLQTLVEIYIAMEGMKEIMVARQNGVIFH